MNGLLVQNRLSLVNYFFSSSMENFSWSTLFRVFVNFNKQGERILAEARGHLVFYRHKSWPCFGDNKSSHSSLSLSDHSQFGSCTTLFSCLVIYFSSLQVSFSTCDVSKKVKIIWLHKRGIWRFFVHFSNSQFFWSFFENSKTLISKLQFIQSKTL